MNKWVYSSVSLNVFACLSFLSIVVFIKSIIAVLLQGDSTAGDFIGFVYLPASSIFCNVLLCTYLIELLLYFVIKKYAFSFPYSKIKYKFLYYLLFYFGMIWGCGIILFIIIDKFTDIFNTLLHFTKYQIINLKLFLP